MRDRWVTPMWSLPATVVSTTLEEPLDWPNATVVSGDAVEVVARLKDESKVPLRSHGSRHEPGADDRRPSRPPAGDALSVITGKTGMEPIFQEAADFDLELVEHRTLDRHIQEPHYRPTLP